MPFQIPGPTNRGYKFPAHRVYLAPTWAADWTLIPGLWCDWCLEGCGTEISRAQLCWDYGRKIYPGDSIWGDYATEDLIDHYCRVEIDQVDEQGQPADPILWTGVVTEVGDAQRGGVGGTQLMIAHGLEILLDRTYINSAWYDYDGVDVQVPRAIQFNAEHDYLDATKTPGERKTKRYGNACSGTGQLGFKVFAGDLKAAAFWSTWDIVVYLLAYHSPVGSAGAPLIAWSITDRAAAMIPNWDKPIVAADGKTIRAVLNELFDRRRLLAWRTVIEDGDPKIDVFSFNHAQLTLPSGGTQQANPNVLALSYANAVDVTASLQSSAAHRVDRVVVRGARKRACFTIAKADSTLELDWKAADELSYESGPTGIDALPWFQRRLRVRAWRREDRFKRVYSYFRVPRDWDYMVGDGVGGTPNLFFPDDDETDAEEIYLPEARFARELFRGALTAAPDDSAEDALQPCGWVKWYSDGGTQRWQAIEKLQMQEAALLPALVAMIDFNCSLRVQEAGLGLAVTVHGSERWDQEAIAKGTFVKLGGSPPVDVHDPLVDWREMAFTVMLELDSRVQAAYPALADFQALNLELARVLEIDLGDRYRLDYVAPGTVKGVQDGVLQRYSEGTWFRDDRAALADIARFTHEWYATERKALHLSVRRLERPGGVEIGTIVSTVDREGEQIDCWTPVTSIHFDLVSGTTAITTAFAELDPLKL